MDLRVLKLLIPNVDDVCLIVPNWTHVARIGQYQQNACPLVLPHLAPCEPIWPQVGPTQSQLAPIQINFNLNKNGYQSIIILSNLL